MVKDLQVAIVDSSNAVYLYEHYLCSALSSARVKVHLIGSKFLNEDVDSVGRSYTRVDVFYKYGAKILIKIGGLPGSKYLKYLTRVIEHIFGLIKLHHYIRKNNIKIVHFQWTQIPFLDNIFIKLNKRLCKFVYTVHNTNINHGDNSYVSNFQKIGYLNFLNKMDALICHTLYSKNNIINYYNFEKKKIYIIPHGKMSTFYSYKYDKLDCVNNKYLIDKNDRLIIFFGNISKYKGLDILLSAYSKLPQNISFKTKLIIIGRNQDQINLSQYKNLPNVIFDNDYISDRWIEPIFKRCELLVLPYRDIDQSGVLMTGIHYRKSIIASDIPAFKEIFGEKGNNHMFKSEDSGDLEKMLTSYLSNELVARSNKESIVHLSDSWVTWEEIAKLTLDVYSNVKL